MRRESRRDFVKLACGALLCASKTASGGQSSESETDTRTRMRQLGFEASAFTHHEYRHAFYSKGEGPIVIVLHELPGFTMPFVGFLNRLAESTFHVHAPLLFGTPFRDQSEANLTRLCISKEFGYLKANRSAPVCDWLRAFACTLSAQNDDARIGVIGMCATGAFVIPMVIEPGVRAGVISQPAIPFSPFYITTGLYEGDWSWELNVSDCDLETAAQKCRQDGTRILVQRFSADRLCTHRRVQRIADAFGSEARLYEYDHVCTDDGHKPCPSHPHALLTTEYDDAPNSPDEPSRIAFKNVVSFLEENLRTKDSTRSSTTDG
jgi:dienelactone hydrolase